MERMCEHVNALAELPRLIEGDGEKYDFRIRCVGRFTRALHSPIFRNSPWAGKCVAPWRIRREFDLLLHGGRVVRVVSPMGPVLDWCVSSAGGI